MAQDTRKDPRAKVLTMTVRYKSATVDEFIEHHSHDVSRGGIYIKTPSPFLPGTLLKFEIRIADDKPMLQGVGRVVWKRDAAGTGPDKPAGMGVKFIKVDEASRGLIDRLVAQKGDETSAYDAEIPADAPAPAPVAAAAPPAPRGGPPRAVPGTPAGGRPAAGAAAMRKGTMMGLGTEGVLAQATKPAARAAEPMFPKGDSEAEMPPPEERTVMKQAAELLEEALKGAGGSIEELGSSKPGEAESAAPVGKHAAPAEVAKPVAVKPPAVKSSLDPSSRDHEPVVTTPAPGPAPRRNTVASTRPVRPAPVAPAVAAVVEPAPKKKGAGGKGIISLAAVAAAATIAYLAWQGQPPPAPVPPPPPSAPQAAAPVPPAPPPPAPAAVSAGTAETAAAASAAPSAAAAASAPSAPVAATAAPSAAAVAATPPAAPVPPAVPPPAAPAAPPPAAPVAPAVSPPVAKPVPAPAAVPAVEKTPVVAPVAKPKPAVKPAEDLPAKPKPARPTDDNPY